MNELLDAAVNPANIIITIMAIFIVIYWLTVIVGVMDVDFLDFDIELEAEAEVDGVSVTWLNSVLSFFNLGQVPVMIFFTFLIIPAWAVTLLVNDFIGNSSFFFGLVVLLAVLFVSLFIAKVLTTPFVKIFARLSKEEGAKDVLMGKVCTVTISTSENKTGLAAIKTEGAPHIINVKTVPGADMEKGETGLVIEHLPLENIYIIEPFN